MLRELLSCLAVLIVGGGMYAALADDPFLGLPLKVEVDIDDTVFSITNAGNGRVAEFATEDRLSRNPTVAVTTDGAAPAIAVTTTRFGTGVESVSRGKGPSANFRIDNPDSAAAALEVSTNGKGPAAKFDGDVVVNGFRVASVPVGTVLPYFGDVASLPAGWLPCDGRVVNDARSSLNGKKVPDLRSMFIRGVDSNNPVGQVRGRDSAPSHSHWFSDSDNAVWFGIQSGNGNIGSYSPNNRADNGGWDQSQLVLAKTPKNADNPYRSHGHMNGQAHISGSTNSGGAHDNRPRYYSLNFIIRTR